MGLKGDKGDKGERGEIGYKGDKGDTGKPDETKVIELKKDLTYLQETIQDIKIPEPIDLNKLKEDLNKYSADHISGLWGTMPDFRAMAMGLEGRISSLEKDDITDYTTFLKLDQTTPQTILNDSPIFDVLTASQIVATDANKKLQTLPVATYPSLTEFSYIKGLSSAIQTQLGGKAATDQTFYIGTTQVAINRASAALTLAGITLTTPNIGVATATANIKGMPQHLRFTLIDPATAYGVSATIPIWVKTDAAITITNLEVSCDADPTTELTGDIKYADAVIGLGNAVVINDFDTTNGVRSDSSITSGAVASGKCIYISFDTTPDAALNTITFDLTFDYD